MTVGRDFWGNRIAAGLAGPRWPGAPADHIFTRRVRAVWYRARPPRSWPADHPAAASVVMGGQSWRGSCPAVSSSLPRREQLFGVVDPHEGDAVLVGAIDRIAKLGQNRAAGALIVAELPTADNKVGIVGAAHHLEFDIRGAARLRLVVDHCNHIPLPNLRPVCRDHSRGVAVMHRGAGSRRPDRFTTPGRAR